jgi:sec-independent protein translocase protein TatA
MMEMLYAFPLFVGLPGGPEMMIILLLVVLLFGANKLPKLARASGQALGEFQKGREEIETELSEMRGIDDDDDEDDVDDDALELESETEVERALDDRSDAAI